MNFIQFYNAENTLESNNHSFECNKIHLVPNTRYRELEKTVKNCSENKSHKSSQCKVSIQIDGKGTQYSILEKVVYLEKDQSLKLPWYKRIFLKESKSGSVYIHNAFAKNTNTLLTYRDCVGKFNIPISKLDMPLSNVSGASRYRILLAISAAEGKRIFTISWDLFELMELNPVYSDLFYKAIEFLVVENDATVLIFCDFEEMKSETQSKYFKSPLVIYQKDK